MFLLTAFEPISQQVFNPFLNLQTVSPPVLQGSNSSKTITHHINSPMVQIKATLQLE